MQQSPPLMSDPASALRAMPWGISSLGCAEFTLEEIRELVADFQISALELRALGGRLDLPEYLAETYGEPAAVMDLLTQANLQVVSLDSSFKLIGSGPEDRAALLAFVPWAEALDVPYIRVFGGGSMDAPLTEAELQDACDQCTWWHDEKVKHGWQVDLILETHDGFSAGDRCLALDARLPWSLPITWDTHHTWKLGGEDVQATWEAMGHLVRHVHIKDSVSVPSARHPYSYVLPGTGEFPAQQTLRVLCNGGYTGVICLEWEKKWHPYMPPLRDALAALATAGWRA